MDEILKQLERSGFLFSLLTAEEKIIIFARWKKDNLFQEKIRLQDKIKSLQELLMSLEKEA